MIKLSESQLLNKVMRELGKHGEVFRTHSGRFFTKSGQPIKSLVKGFSDCMLILPGGQVCFIETKVKPNKPSPEQTTFIRKMKDLGCRAGVAFSVDEALQICEIDKGDKK